MDEDFDDGGGSPEDYGMDQADFNAASSIGEDIYNDNRGGDSSEDLNSSVENLTQKQAYTTGRGATATNPYPESFFSRMFGAENVNYTNILGGGGKGGPGEIRINEINDLRYNQAIGGMSNRTGKQYTANDYYIGQSTDMGTVKPIPSTARDFMNFMPGGGILNAMAGQPGLPEFDPRYQEIMNEKAKSANDPTVFDGVTDFLKDQFGMGPKDSGASLAAGSLKEGQFGIPDNRKFDAFGNESATEIDFPNSFSSRPEPEGYNTVINPVTGRMELRDNKIEPSQIFKNIGDQANQTVATTPNFSVPGFTSKSMSEKESNKR